MVQRLVVASMFHPEGREVPARRESKIGTLAVGNQADLMLVHGDPASTVADIEKVDTVFMSGVGYDPAKLIASARGRVGTR
jgi:cytosine/adenosine deaminase-related metal-dependent hydrolase